MTRTFRRLFLLITIILAACQPQAAVVLTSTPKPTVTATATVLPTETPTATPSPVPSPTLYPLTTLDAILVPCDERRPADDLFVIVNATFGLDPNYIPGDLVKLGGYVSGYVTLPDLLLRREAAGALGRLVAAMQADDLTPIVLSAYRSYYYQIVVYQKWQKQDPAFASQVSAEPGHSEHQLGTVVDFGSYELPSLTGDPAIKFSPLFAQTGEGLWLAEHAHEYGFTMTNPPEAEPWTGLIYEPWHYRYVGVDLATYLHESGDFLIRYLFQVRPGLPCTLE
jgi:D-alanyl-D-alanine carboxypeptidase